MAYQNQFSVSNGTTDVTVLAAPAASTSRTIPAGAINIVNLDTATIVVTLQIKDNATDRVQETAMTILAGKSWSNDKQVLCLDATTQTLEIFLAGAVAATEADISVMYRDEGQ